MRIDKYRLPVEIVGTKIRMDPKLLRSCVRLEINICRMIDILKKSANFHAIKYLPLPEAHKLDAEYADRESLLREALATRDRFLYLCATLSFFVCIKRDWANYTTKTDTGEPVESTWMEFQGECIVAGVHAQWVVLLFDSPISRTNVKRRGVIIDYRKSELSPLVSYMLSFNVPLVLRIDEETMYHDVDLAHQDRILNRFRKLNFESCTLEQMNKLLRKYIPPPDFVKKMRDKALRQMEKDFAFRLDDSNLPSQNASSWSTGHWVALSAQDPRPQVTEPFVESREELFARREKERDWRLVQEFKLRTTVAIKIGEVFRQWQDAWSMQQGQSICLGVERHSRSSDSD